jgi:hypothetical protein
MPINKDLKRLVRARMQKTGEAYTAARAHVVKYPARAIPARTAARVEPVAAVPPAEYARLAGMADAKVKAATACTWERWVYALDRHKAYELTHRELAKLIQEKYKTGPWWTQTVAVGYERIKGLREKGQQRNGTYRASKSRTFNVPATKLFDAWADARKRRQWLDGGTIRVRTSTRPKSMRLEIDGAVVIVGFIPKGAGKSSLSIEQDRLPDKSAVDGVKQFWSERLDELKSVLAV